MSGPPDAAPGRPPITGVPAPTLCQVLSTQPPYRIDQLQRALYRESATEFEQILTLPTPLRSALAQRFRYESLDAVHTERSSDGTRKTLFRTADGAPVETVQMPTERAGATTICLSSQAGCGMGCTFCATGAMGLTRNLTGSEIVDQFLHFRRRSDADRTPDRAVFMGMGEPLANLQAVEAAVRTLVDPAAVGLSPRRVTVSTVGLPRGIHAMAGWGLPVSLAISLHAADNDLRTHLVPVARRFPLDSLMEASRRYQRRARRRVTYEYTLLDGVNDAPAQALGLARLLRGQRCHVNLIPFNAYPGARYRPTPRAAVRAFRDTLREHGLRATVRRTRGRDISGACGQLHAGALAPDGGVRG
ncbi:MAG: 23S rRNA (adenine(2503)-C(2))-methyltransferase RlmN [Chloroflexi bacterium]|nr:23S rRNA (adenine(2503)-C(2))-methyltransferase RlmN [Chloroflexota bacterium]MCY3959769.1 23S rRNA (adenine(2503)-C(2))-methyltransferase RlmN [Chloroflexota bacterium]